ncbi:MAG: hypothetical protein QN130_12295 [Armatimonadota bacterium]|nr:hypothetical protein [Armatimonadota bacterium]
MPFYRIPSTLLEDPRFALARDYLSAGVIPTAQLPAWALQPGYHFVYVPQEIQDPAAAEAVLREWAQTNPAWGQIVRVPESLQGIIDFFGLREQAAQGQLPPDWVTALPWWPAGTGPAPAPAPAPATASPHPTAPTAPLGPAGAPRPGGSWYGALTMGGVSAEPTAPVGRAWTPVWYTQAGTGRRRGNTFNFNQGLPSA